MVSREPAYSERARYRARNLPSSGLVPRSEKTLIRPRTPLAFPSFPIEIRAMLACGTIVVQVSMSKTRTDIIRRVGCSPPQKAHISCSVQTIGLRNRPMSSTDSRLTIQCRLRTSAGLALIPLTQPGTDLPIGMQDQIIGPELSRPTVAQDVGDTIAHFLLETARPATRDHAGVGGLMDQHTHAAIKTLRTQRLVQPVGCARCTTAKIVGRQLQDVHLSA